MARQPWFPRYLVDHFPSAWERNRLTPETPAPVADGSAKQSPGGNMFALGKEPERGYCTGCDTIQQIEHNMGHVVSEHNPNCDGYCRECPVPALCGPILIGGKRGFRS